MSQAFRIVDRKTGKALTVYGDVAPTPEEEQELFAAYEKGTWRPKGPPKPFDITDKESGETLTVYGDKAPTKEEQAELFTAYKQGTWKPKPPPEPPGPKKIYTENQILNIARSRVAGGEAPADVEAFVTQALKDKAASKGPDIPELKAYTPPAGYQPSAAEIQMRERQQLLALEKQTPQLTRAMMGGRAQPSQMMTPQESEEYLNELAIKARNEMGIPESVSRMAAAGGTPVDVGLKVVAPLAVGAITRDPTKMFATGALTDLLVQKREQLRGEREKFAPSQALVEGGLTAIVPPVLPAARAGMATTLRAAEAAAIRAGQTGTMIGAGEAVQQVMGDKPADLGEVFDVATLGALFGGAFGALETTAPAIWSKIRGMKPSQAIKTLREMPETPATKEAITNLEQVVEQHLAPKPVDRGAAIDMTVGPREPVGRPAMQPAFEGLPPSKSAEEAAQVLGSEEAAKSFEAMAAKRMVEGLEAPREVSLTEAIEGGLPPPAPTKAKASGLREYAEASEAARAFEGLPPARRAEEAARVFEEAAAKAERAAAFSAKELGDQLTQNRLGTEEAIPLTEAQRLAKMEARGQELEKEALKARQRELKARPGEAAKEQGTITQRLGRMAEEEAQVEAAFKAGETPRRSSDEEVVMPTGEAPGPELSPQAQRMAERYGRANVGLLANVATGGGGFVVGWNTGEGLPPEERLARALAFGAGGAFTPTAIRRIIGMQKWADSVIKERGVGSGSLNTADPQILAALSVKGAAMVGEGVKNFAEWGDKMVRQYGDSIRPKLKEIWAAGQEADIIPNKLVDKAPERPPKSLRSKGLVSPGKMAEAPERKVIRLGDRSKQRQEATDLLSEFAEKNKLTHMGAGLWAGEKAQLELKPGFGREWNLSFIGTRPEDRGKGYASNLLSRIVDFADKNGLPIKLVVEPTGEGKQRGLNAGQLISWYERKGFKLDEGSDNKMTRLPQNPARVAQTPETPTRIWETPEFKQWFKKSEVVNEDGTPMRVYHGTTKNNLTKFDQRSGGIWVAFDPQNASPGTGDEATSVIPLYVSAQKIYKLTPEELSQFRFSNSPKKRVMEVLNRERGNGYDAVQVGNYALVVNKPTQVKSAIKSGFSEMDPRIAGFITKQLAIPLGTFAGGFTYGFIDGKDLPADERLLRALQWAAVAGGVGYAAAKRSLKAINNERVPEATAKKLAPEALTGEEVLAKVRKTFTPEPTELTKEQKMLTTPVAKLVQSFQNVFRPLSEVEKNLIGRGDNLLLGDAASLVAGSVGKAEAALYPLQQAQKDLIPDVSKETLNDYLFLRRVIDRLSTGPETRQVAGYDIPQSRMGLDAIRKQLGDDAFVKLEEFARVVQISADEDLKLMVRSGRMSQQNYDEIKAMNDFYAPFYVMEYFTQQDGALQGMGKALDTAQPLTKAIKGIKDEDFKLIDIMSGFQINKMRAQVLADKNVIMRRMADLSRLDTQHRFMKDLGSSIEAKYSGEMPKGWETVNYMENGVQKKLAVLPEVAAAVKGMDTIRADAFMTTLAAFAGPLRAGATGLNLGFQIVNVFKDAARLGIMSKYGIEKNPVDFFQFVGDLFVGAIHSWRSNLLGDKSQLYLDFLKSGAARSTMAANLTPDALSRAMQQGDEKLAAKIIKAPLRSFITGTEKMGNAIEETIKLAGFRRGVRAEGLGKLSGKAYDDALEQIAYEVRNYAGSPDFSKHGTHGRSLNVLFMFANARIQGSAADLRRLIGQTGTKERNQAAVRLAAGIGSATTYLWYLNNQPDNVEDYNKRSLSERNSYFLFPRYTETGDPMYYINEEGQKIREYYRFPKFEVVGMMANVLESALNYSAKKDPKGIIETGKVALENLSPIPITGRNFLERVQSVASGLNPVFKAPLELATNTSFYQHRDIVKQRLQNVRPEEQYLETTPKAFIDVAQAMPEAAPDFLRSPLYLKNLTENFTGSLLTQFMRPQLEGRSSATTNPLVARFFSSPIVDEQETWDEINKYKTEQSTASLLRERAINEYLKNSAGYTPAQRMQSLAQILASDPENNAVAMYNALRDRSVGVTDVDRSVRSLQPQFRAQFIENKAQKMQTPQERDAFYLDMVRKGLINKETAEEIIKMRAAPAGKKTSFKEGRLYRDPTSGVMKVYRNGAFV
jgi:GNAT superfamily N-acetyltransferase